MALIIADRVKETTITSGVGTLTLSGSTFGGFQTFAEAIGDGNTTYYCIQNEGQFEIGIGTYTSSGNTLSRDTVFQSSNSDNKINISGVGLVFCVVPADKLVYKDGDDSVVFPTPFVFKRSDDGDYWQALSTDYTNRVASFYIEEGTDPTWKIGLKTSNSEIIAPYYAYVSGKDGFVELRGNASSILSIGDEDTQGLQVNHQLKNIIDIRKNGGEIAIQNLDLNSDETTSAKNNSIAYTVFAVESSAGHAADLQTWSVATDEKASLNQYGDLETVGSIIAPSGRFTAIRFSDGSIQTTAALPFASGALIDQNAADIITQSGYFQSAIDSIDSTAVSGWAESYIDQTSGNLQVQIDINESNISTVSGLIGDADFLPGASGGLIDQNSQDILTVSGLLYDDSAVSGYFESRVDSSDSAINTVSGLLTPSGESFNFAGNLLTYNNSDGGSFTADLSSLSTFDTSGVSLAYSAGTLTYTNNAGGSFDVDISSISGDVYALIVDGAPTTLDTLNEIAAALNDDENIANTLTTLISTTSGNLQSQITSNDGDITQLNSDITTVSGLLYDDAAISGYFESRVDQADADIVTVSGLLYDDAAISGYFESRVDQADTDIATVSGLLYDDAAISGYFESRVDQADADIVTVSGLLYDDSAVSGYFESRVDQADSDIATVSGLLDSVTPTGTPSGVGFFDNAGSLSGNSSFTYDGANVRLFGNIDVSGISTFGSGIKTYLRTEADATTITFDMDQSNNYTAELGGNRTLAVSNVDAGQKFTIRLTQDATGSREPTWWSGITWLTSDGSEPTLKTGSGEIDYFGFISTSGGYYEGFHLTEAGGGGGGGSSTITVKEADGTPNVSNVSTIVVSNGTLTNDGGGQVTITTGGGGGGSYDDTYISGVSTFASGLAIQNQADIATVSGLLYDDTAISGYFESRVDQADTDIATVSGLLYDDTAISGYFESRVDANQAAITSNDADIAYLSGIAVYGSGHTLQTVTDNGASTTNAVTINNNNITASSGLFNSLDMTPLGDANYPAWQEGVVFYDAESHSLAVYNDEADITLQVGQEEYLRVRNNTGSTIENGTAVMINGIHGNAAPTISGAIATSNYASQVVGLATHSIEDQTFGYVTTYGIVRDVDTSAFTAGDEIFLSATQIGSGTNVSPVIPNYKVNLGHVINSSSSNGSILVQVGQPKLGGGDMKSEAPLNLSGIPFVTQIADTTAGGSQTDPLFIFDSGNRQLQLGSGLQLLDGVPSNTSNVLYNDAGTLKFNGSAIGGGGGTTYTAGSGLSLVGTEFNVYGGSGNFRYAELTASDEVPTFKYLGSGVTDTPINLEVRSSFQSATGSGTALLFQGTQGQLFSITDNLSSGTIFNVSDITGLPMLEVTASGDVEIGEFADNITIHQPVLLSGGVPSNTTNKLYNDAGSLYFNGSAVGGSSYNDAPLSGYFESRVDQADIDIATVSGLLYDDTAISGYFESRVDQADADIISSSGYFEDNILELVGVSGIDITSAGSTVNISAGSLSGYFESRVDSADTNISTNSSSITANSGYFESRVDSADSSITANSGYFESRVDSADSSITANSGYFESRVDTNAADIVTVSGLTNYTAGSGLTLSGTEFNIYGGSGNFESIDLTTDSAVVPKMVFTGSGVNNSPITLRVESNFQSATGSGTALLFEGEEGVLFSITDNLSSGVIFNVTNDLGLPLVEVEAYGDVKIGENASGITLYQPVLISGGVPADTTNKLYNDGGTLSFNGSAVDTNTTYSAGSGLTLVDTEFNVYGGSGHFINIQNDGITTLNSGIKTVINTEVDGATITFDMNTANSHVSTLGGNRTLAVSNVDAGQKFFIKLSQDGVGSRTVTWWNTINWLTSDGSAPTLKTDPGADDYLGFVCTSGGYYDGFHLTSTGGGTSYTAGSGLTLQGTEFNVHGGSGQFIDLKLQSDGIDDLLTLTSTDDGSSAAPVICTMRDSATPSDGDYLGQIKFKGRSDTGTERVYAKITGKTLDVTNGTEDGLIEIAVISDGSQEIISRIRNDGWRIVNDNNLYIQDNGSLGVRVNPSYSLHVKDDAYIGSGVTLPDVTPAVTTNKLYNDGGTLKFNGSAVGGASLTAGSGITIDGADQINVHGGSGHFINLDVEGAFTATTKSFLIDHPSKEGMRLQYASLEGPENGVYVRGTTDKGFITLPDYWRDLVHNGSITVTLTPVGQFQPLFVEQKNNREIRVGGVCGYYDYVVWGERKDVDKLEVEW